MDLHLSNSDGFPSPNIYDTRNNFDIINFHYEMEIFLAQDDVWSTQNGYSFDPDTNGNNDINNDEINCTITENEILATTKSLKNKKSSELENIVNEHIKSTIHDIIPICKKAIQSDS